LIITTPKKVPTNIKNLYQYHLDTNPGWEIEIYDGTSRARITVPLPEGYDKEGKLEDILPVEVDVTKQDEFYELTKDIPIVCALNMVYHPYYGMLMYPDGEYGIVVPTAKKAKILASHVEQLTDTGMAFLDAINSIKNNEEYN
jgi:hypothetical protein